MVNSIIVSPHQQELEKAGAELKIANERLKELDRLKEGIISTVTHELRPSAAACVLSPADCIEGTLRVSQASAEYQALRDFAQPMASKGSLKITSHFIRRCIPSGCVAKARNIRIFLCFRALPNGRLNA